MSGSEREHEQCKASDLPPQDAPGSAAGEPHDAHCAAEAVRRAEAELKKAKELYGQLRRQAADRLKSVRESSLGDVIDGTLKLVRKYPAPGVIAAGLVGFFLGRLFRR